MEKTYVKHSETELAIEITPPVQTEIFALKDLKQQVINKLAYKASVTNKFNDFLNQTDLEIAEIQVKITEAEKLGIKDSVEPSIEDSVSIDSVPGGKI